VLQVEVWKKKQLKNSGRLNFAIKSLYEKYKYNRKRRFSSVSRLRSVERGVYGECGFLDMDHLNERNVRTFAEFF